MRTINTAGQALLDAGAAGARVRLAQLVYLATSVPQYWSAAGMPLVWDGHTWEATDVAIGEVEDSSAGLNDLTFTLPGVTPAQLAFGFDSVAGTAVRVYDAFVDADGVVADAVLAWAGELDIPGWQDGTEASVLFTAVHQGKAALRPKPFRYTNDEQLRAHPGDTSLDVDPMTDGAGIVWPNAAYFKQS